MAVWPSSFSRVTSFLIAHLQHGGPIRVTFFQGSCPEALAQRLLPPFCPVRRLFVLDLGGPELPW